MGWFGGELDDKTGMGWLLMEEGTEFGWWIWGWLGAVDSLGSEPG